MTHFSNPQLKIFVINYEVAVAASEPFQGYQGFSFDLMTRLGGGGE